MACESAVTALRYDAAVSRGVSLVGKKIEVWCERIKLTSSKYQLLGEA